MVAKPALSAGGQQAPSHLGHASALQRSCSGGMLHGSSMLHLFQHVVDPTWLLQALPIFLDRLVDPVTAVVLSVTVVLFFGESSTEHATNITLQSLVASHLHRQSRLSLPPSDSCDALLQVRLSHKPFVRITVLPLGLGLHGLCAS